MMKYRHIHPGRKISAWLQSIMAILYIGVGIFLFSSEKAHHFLPANMLPWVAAALFFYGLFRAYRAWNHFKNIPIRQA
jgi:hypothetical protein